MSDSTYAGAAGDPSDIAGAHAAADRALRAGPDQTAGTRPAAPGEGLPGTVRLRVAPSPTGDPHVGTAYMSLFNLAFVRQQGGRFVLRIEDTDQALFREDSEQQVFDTLRWLGLNWDEGPDVGGPCAPYRQSERLDTYAPYVDRLLADGNAYRCWCSPERLAQMREEQQRAKRPTGYDRLCLGKSEEERQALPGFSPTSVVRMLVPDDAPLEFDDLIRGRVSAPRPDDQVILKADGFPTYHLAVVVDDHEMGITHVVRGEEWISSTPKHVLLLRNPDRSKISKRRNPAARLTWFQEQGYLPEALVNFLALLAYPPAEGAEGEDVEVYTFEEFSTRFDWTEVNPVGPIFDLRKLDWLNGVHLRALDLDDFTARLLPFLQGAGLLGENPSLGELARLRSVAALIQTRIVHLTEAADLVAPFYVDDHAVAVADDARTSLGDDAPHVLDAAIEALVVVPEDWSGVLGSESSWTAGAVEGALRAALVDGLGVKPRFAFGPLRNAVSGRRVSPPLFESMEILGKEATLTRLRTFRAAL